MIERPIICPAHEVRAILDGRLAQLRRVVVADVEFIAGAGDDRDDPGNWGVGTDDGCWVVLDQSLPPWTGSGSIGECYRYTCPLGAVGDRLWVRETYIAYRYRVRLETEFRRHAMVRLRTIPTNVLAAFVRCWAEPQPEEPPQ